MRVIKKFRLRFAAALVVLLVLAMVSGCSASVELDPYFFYTALVQRATMQDEYPDGFFQLGFMAAEEGGKLLTVDSFRNKLRRAVIVAPGGEEFEVKPYQEFDFIGEDNWQGYFVMGAEEQHVAWLYVDRQHNEANPPQEGVYTLRLISSSGDESRHKAEFYMNPAARMDGFPTNLRYDAAERRLEWDFDDAEEVRYRVYAFEGDSWDEDWSRMVYSSVPTGTGGTQHVVPSFVKFEPGQQYTFMIEAFRLPYFNIQDDPQEMVFFTAE